MNTHDNELNSCIVSVKYSVKHKKTINRRICVSLNNWNKVKDACAHILKSQNQKRLWQHFLCSFSKVQRCNKSFHEFVSIGKRAIHAFKNFTQLLLLRKWGDYIQIIILIFCIELNSLSIERPSDKRSKSFSCISWVTHDSERISFRVINTLPGTLHDILL